MKDMIRRILRRAVRYGFTFKCKALLCINLLKYWWTKWVGFFQKLKQQTLVEKVIQEEEQSFMRTLENGLKRIDDIANASKETLVDGAKAFELYDTFGFLIDLTALILSENGEVDMEGFDVEMKKQKEVLKASICC